MGVRSVAVAGTGLLLILGTGAKAEGGEDMFVAQCSACHQKGGIGTPGLAPPIASEELARILTKAEGRSYVPLVVLNGLSGQITVAGQPYFSAMPARADLDDATVATIAGYVLAALNGVPIPGDEAYDASEVAALRAAPHSHEALRALRKALLQ